jgi:hypothetical protein
MEQDFVGTKRWIRPATPYEVFMRSKLPIHRGTVGFYDIRDLTLRTVSTRLDRLAPYQAYTSTALTVYHRPMREALSPKVS